MCVASLSNSSFSYEKLPSEKPSPPYSDENKPTNPLESHVVEIPKEQIHGDPPPGNDEPGCGFIAFLLIIAAVFCYFVILTGIGSQSPAFTVTKVAVHGVDLTSSPPGFDVTIRVENWNDDLVTIHYLKHSAVNVSYAGLRLGSGVLPDFYQPKKNVTVMPIVLTASDEFVDGVAETALRYDERRGKVPLEFRIEAPYQNTVGFLKSVNFIAMVKCDVVLNKFNDKAKIISTSCSPLPRNRGYEA